MSLNPEKFAPTRSQTQDPRCYRGSYNHHILLTNLFEDTNDVHTFYQSEQTCGTNTNDDYAVGTERVLQHKQHVRLAGGWWPLLICPERKILLGGCWWLICSERKVLFGGCWWLVCSERKVLLAGG
jgi:hypothetical protein